LISSLIDKFFALLFALIPAHLQSKIKTKNEHEMPVSKIPDNTQSSYITVILTVKATCHTVRTNVPLLFAHIY